MNDKKIVQQLIEYHKAAFENTFNSLTALHEQTEKIINNFVRQAAWIPEEGKTVISEWINTYKKGQIDFKTAVDSNYALMENYFSAAVAQPKPKATKKK